jgi:hypothetical protein
MADDVHDAVHDDGDDGDAFERVDPLGGRRTSKLDLLYQTVLAWELRSQHQLEDSKAVH